MKKNHRCILRFMILFFLDCQIHAFLEEKLLLVNDEENVLEEMNSSYSAIQHEDSKSEMVPLYGKTVSRKTRSLGTRQINPDPAGYDSNNTMKFPTADDRNQTKMVLDNLNLTSNILYRTLQIDHLYCPMSTTCLLSPRLRFPDIIPYQSCCGTCSCVRDCHVSRTCCADADNDITETSSSVDCILPQYLPYDKSEVNHHLNQIISVVKCKSEYTGLKERDLCEEPGEMLSSLDTSLPVIANDTVYRNRFCALCNGASESDIQSFAGQLVCPDGMGVYAYTISDLLEQLINERRCNILFNFPRNTPENIVFKSRCNVGYVRKCNETGKWRQHDPDIERACKSYTHIYRGIYRNVFCYICNNEMDPFMKCSNDDINTSGGFVMGAFTAMLRFSDRIDETVVDSDDASRCKTDEIWDYFQNECLSVKCSSPFSFDKNKKTCSKVFLDAKNMYELSLHVAMDANSKPEFLLPYIKDYLRHGSSVWEILWNQVYEVSIVNMSSPIHAIYHLIYYDDDSMSRIEYVLKIVDYITSMFGMVNYVGILTDRFYEDFDNLSSYHFPYDGRPLQQKISAYTLSPSKFNYNVNIKRFSKLLICPYITLENYTTFLSKTKYELCVIEINVCFQESEFLKINDLYLVCLEKFVKSMKKLSTPRMLSSYDDVEGVMSLVCTCISVASLLYVAVTFALFKSLRTFPGKLILVLALSLIIAHLLYQFGLFQTEHRTICTVLGIMIHFSWLWVVFWMNISCFHMVNVFTRTMPLATHTNSRFFCYTLYVFFFSVSFVGINIVVSEIHGNGIGYGDIFCWISRTEMVRYVFALPLGLVVIFNVLMFLGVVMSLQRRPNLQQSKDRNRQDLIIFVKLTSITGVSWVFGFLYEWLNIKVFSYLFIVLTGSQGLYLMIAFSCNSRVKRLYTAAFQGSRTNSSSKSNSSSYHVTKISRNSA